MKKLLNGSAIDVPEFVCPICGKCFASIGELISHYKGHYNKGNRSKRRKSG